MRTMLLSRHLCRQLATQAAAPKRHSIPDLIKLASSSRDEAVTACKSAVKELDSANEEDVKNLTEVFRTAFLSHPEGKTDARILNTFAQASRQSPYVCEALTLTQVPQAALNLISSHCNTLGRGTSSPHAPSGVIAALDTLTAFLDVRVHPNLLWFENAEGVTHCIKLLNAHPSHTPLVAATLHLLSAALKREETAKGHVATLMPILEAQVSLERIYDQKAQPTVQAALALLRQLSSFSTIGKELNLELVNCAIRAIRADTKDWETVDHAVAFLANIRTAHKATGFGEGQITEPDFVLTIVDAIQTHPQDAWLVANSFKFLCGVDRTDSALTRLGLHHAKSLRRVLSGLRNVADVQAYGCLAIAIAATRNALPFLKAGFLEHTELVRMLFGRDPFVSNCASYLAHALRRRSPDEEPAFVSIPQEWDPTLGGPGTLIKLEGAGMVTYLGASNQLLNESDRQHFAGKAKARGLGSVDDDDLPFSDEEALAQVQDDTVEGLSYPGLDGESSEDEVPDFELMDSDPLAKKALGLTEAELAELTKNMPLEKMQAKDWEWAVGPPELHVFEERGPWIDPITARTDATVEEAMFESVIKPMNLYAEELRRAINKERGATPDAPLDPVGPEFRDLPQVVSETVLRQIPRDVLRGLVVPVGEGDTSVTETKSESAQEAAAEDVKTDTPSDK